MTPDLSLLDRRHEVPPEELSEFVSTNFGGNLLTLRQLEPFISEIRRRFKILPRKANLGGYKTISGHRSFKTWCSGVLGRTDRTVRYMLAKSKNEEKKLQKQAETISAVLNRTLVYIMKQKLDEQTKNEIAAILSRRIEKEK
jgi:hypothetical protein